LSGPESNEQQIVVNCYTWDKPRQEEGLALAKRKSFEELEAEQDASLVPMVVTAITPLQQTYIEHLLSGKNITEAALASGISQRTAARWLALGHPVHVEYEKQRLQVLAEFRSRMSTLTGMAIDTLQAALSSEVDLKTRIDVAKFLYTQQLSHGPGHLALPGSAEGLISVTEKQGLMPAISLHI
jgi:hypothetical protein